MNEKKGYILPLFRSTISFYPFSCNFDKMLEVYYPTFWKLVLETWYSCFTFKNTSCRNFINDQLTNLRIQKILKIEKTTQRLSQSAQSPN